MGQTELERTNARLDVLEERQNKNKVLLEQSWRRFERLEETQKRLEERQNLIIDALKSWVGDAYSKSKGKDIPYPVEVIIKAL